jgi:hypothetical protein
MTFVTYEPQASSVTLSKVKNRLTHFTIKREQRGEKEKQEKKEKDPEYTLKLQ